MPRTNTVSMADLKLEPSTVPGYKGIGPAKRVQLVPRTQGSTVIDPRSAQIRAVNEAKQGLVLREHTPVS